MGPRGRPTRKIQSTVRHKKQPVEAFGVCTHAAFWDATADSPTLNGPSPLGASLTVNATFFHYTLRVLLSTTNIFAKKKKKKERKFLVLDLPNQGSVVYAQILN